MNTTYFFLRKTNTKGGGIHRFGCIMLGTTETPGVVRVSYSVTSDLDRFNTRLALTKAVGRMNSDKRSVTVSIDKLTDVYALLDVLGLTSIIARHHEGFHNARNESAFLGAISELTNQAKPA